jgi:hypothetical protein
VEAMFSVSSIWRLHKESVWSCELEIPCLKASSNTSTMSELYESVRRELSAWVGGGGGVYMELSCSWGILVPVLGLLDWGNPVCSTMKCRDSAIVTCSYDLQSVH